MTFAKTLLLSFLLSIVSTFILWQIQSIFNLNWFLTFIIGFIIAFTLIYFLTPQKYVANPVVF